eukprot:PhF_6_TR39424/c0_g1_i1/m.58617
MSSVSPSSNANTLRSNAELFGMSDIWNSGTASFELPKFELPKFISEQGRARSDSIQMQFETSGSTSDLAVRDSLQLSSFLDADHSVTPTTNQLTAPHPIAMDCDELSASMAMKEDVNADQTLCRHYLLGRCNRRRCRFLHQHSLTK